MNSYVHQYPAALYSQVSGFGYRTEAFTGEVLRSGSSNRSPHRRPLLRWLRPSTKGQTSQPRERHEQARPVPSPHHFELKFHRNRHAHSS